MGGCASKPDTGTKKVTPIRSDQGSLQVDSRSSSLRVRTVCSSTCIRKCTDKYHTNTPCTQCSLQCQVLVAGALTDSFRWPMLISTKAIFLDATALRLVDLTAEDQALPTGL